MNQNALAKDHIKQFASLIEQGKQSFIEAGKQLAKAVEEVPGFVKLLLEACPQFTERFIRKMIDLGHGSLHPELLIGESSGERALAKLSYSWQDRYVTTPVPLLLKKDAGFDELLVPVRDLTPEQCRQVFADDAVRTPAQQRVYLENSWAKTQAPPTKTNLPYRILGKKLVVMVPATFTRKELAQFLAEME